MSKTNNSKGGGGKQTHPQPQSAVTGQFVTQQYANSHPNTTFTITPKPAPKKR